MTHHSAATRTVVAPPVAVNAVSVVKVKRTQEERSRDARERLLQSAVDTLFDRGYAGFTTKEVAGRAGFSVGALMHHYPTKAELAVAATAFIYEQAIARGRLNAAASAAAMDPLMAFVHDSLTVYRDWPFLAALEVIIVARTDPGLMTRIVPVMENYRKVTDETWIDVFAGVGYSRERAANVLKLVLTLIRGMAVNSLWQRDPAMSWTNLEAWVALAARAVLGAKDSDTQRQVIEEQGENHDRKNNGDRGNGTHRIQRIG